MITTPSGLSIALLKERLTFAQTMKFAETNTLPSNKDVSSLLRSGGLRGDFRTGTIVVAEVPCKGFSAAVEFDGVSVSIPKRFQGLKDVALVCEYPDYTFQKGVENGVLTMGKNIIVVENYPRIDGWYLPHEDTMIPQGKRVSSLDSDVLYLYRASGAYAGSVVRGGGYDRRSVDLDCRAGVELRVAQYIGESNGGHEVATPKREAANVAQPTDVDLKNGLRQ